MKYLRTFELIDDIVRSGSIRKTAERLAITPSALTRQIQDFEHAIGALIFERLAHGMRLSAAGELVISHIREQLADFDRLRARLADLAGVRRGHVAVACSQAFADNVMPDEIHAYRTQHPLVSFAVHVRDHADAIATLIAYEADLALVLEPPPSPDLHVLFRGEQPLCALMARDHALAGEGPVRLRDCLTLPIAMPGRSLAIRRLLDAATARGSARCHIAVESDSLEFLRNYVRREPVISFQIPSGIPAGSADLCVRPIDGRDLAPAQLILGQLRGRNLSVAAAKFADQLTQSLDRLHPPSA